MRHCGTGLVTCAKHAEVLAETSGQQGVAQVRVPARRDPTRGSLTCLTCCCRDLRAAQEIDSGNTAWILASAALVLLMTPALAFFYGGMVRAKHILAC